jgi:hypothetical protein
MADLMQLLVLMLNSMSARLNILLYLFVLLISHQLELLIAALLVDNLIPLFAPITKLLLVVML